MNRRTRSNVDQNASKQLPAQSAAETICQRVDFTWYKSGKNEEGQAFSNSDERSCPNVVVLKFATKTCDKLLIAVSGLNRRNDPCCRSELVRQGKCRHSG